LIARRGYNAMDRFFRQIFLAEIEMQSDYALEAMNLLRQSLPNPDRSFFYIQAFLVSAANVSKLLWPKDEKRGEELRQILNVGENSPIADRTLRNHFEHFDERIERWAAQSKRHIFIDRSIISGPVSRTPRVIGGVEPTDVMRTLYSSSLVITFQSDTYDLPTVEQALKEVRESAREKLAGK
jgi:hypothetical protein